MNWSRLDTRRSTFFAVLWPTWFTAASWRPLASNTPYWLLSSMIFAFWFTTRIGSSKIDPLPANATGPTLALRAVPSPDT
ncbi:MAG: hypothetical protein R2713_17295 [Ilumatobacteraceae bacterium]